LPRTSRIGGESGDSLLNPHSSAKTGRPRGSEKFIETLESQTGRPGRPRGSEKFIETLESQTGRPLKRQKPGRKPFK
jgi:hypothetical protein